MASLHPVIVGLGAGCATALLLAALLTGSEFALPLFLASPLPIAIATLGWGTASGTMAGATVGIACVLMAGSVSIAFAAVLLVAAPTVLVGSYLARPWVDPIGDPRLWQPLGRGLFLGAAFIAAALIAVGLMIGFDPEALADEAASAIRLWLSTPPTGGTVSPEDLDAFARLNLTVLPYTTAALALLMLVVALWLGNRIVMASGRPTRPPKPLWTAELPVAAAAIFILALAASFIEAPFGPAAAAVAGAFGMAETLVGLAVLHALTRGLPGRPFIVAGLYIVLLALRPAIAVVALLGVADGVLRFRRRAGLLP